MNPPLKPRLPASPGDWLNHARSDLKLARLGASQDVLPEQICFHAQQAVEKALKAVLLFSGTDFPLTHDIEELLDTMDGVGIIIPNELKQIGALTPYAVESRYPGYWGEITRDDVAEALMLAEKTASWADEYIRKPG
ncbi:MAG: HEPN domain-containing protein [Nitrospirota bacterium]